ncbi:MAG: HDOD domain-containing protein [Planctomycetota bacterium]|nr:HDOD domain-containing protein [Planctomycetota bacterium]
MTVKSADSAQVVTAAVREVSQIATLPEITLKIVELVESPSSTAQDLHNVISNDPALCSRILKVVNSSFYGMPGQIGSINRAIVLLGLNAVKNIAISASLAKLFKGGQLCPSFSAKDLWKHSVATAATSKLLADAMGLGLTDEAFLAGLIHDIGIMVELQYDRAKLIEVVNQLGAASAGAAPTVDMLEVEQRVFGATHQEFGKGLCEKWKFPKSFAAVAGFHHAPLTLPEQQRTLPCIVSAADHISASLGGGFRLDVRDTTIDPAVLDVLKLPAAKIDELKQTLPKQIAEVEALLAG